MPYPEPARWSAEVTEPIPAENTEALARQYGRKVFMAAYRVLGNAALAEDVQQDVFLRLLESRPPPVESWPAYLTTAAVRAAIDVLRRQRRWARVMALWGPQPDTSAESAECAGVEQERARRLRAALAALPRREAQCFGLRYLQGLEIPDIALALGLSANNVNVVLHRARRRLESDLRDATQENR